MTVVAIQLIVVYHDGGNPDLMEAGLMQSFVLAKSSVISDWANQEITDGGLAKEALQELANRELSPGVYSLLGMFRLRGGKDPDTPNGPGEYWSDCLPIEEPSIERLTIDEASEFLDEGVEFEKEDLDVLFKGETKQPLTFQFQGLNNDEDAPHSQG